MFESHFTVPEGAAWLRDWCDRVIALSRTPWQRRTLDTAFGETVLHTARADREELPAILFLPGFRTCGLFFDLNDNLALLGERHRVYLVDVIGQPSLSAGRTPPVRGTGYGQWLLELLDKLGLDQVDVVGASFGGILAVKLAAAAPGRVRSITLMAPGGLQSVSLWSMGDNLLPMVWSSETTVRRFLDRVVFTRTHTLSPERYQLLVDYQLHAITRFKSRAQYPYRMPREELAALTAPTWVLIGERDPMFPHARSAERARADIPGLQEVIVLRDHGHGVETSLEATRQLQQILTR